jgi:UDP-N-acetylmuramoylalanine--D-glutamate ligase
MNEFNDYVLIQGLGLNQGGVGAAKFFAEKGKKVVVTDLKPERELKPSVAALSDFDNIDFVLGEHRENDFKNASLLISSPAVPPNSKYVNIARDNNIPTYCPMTYFFAHKKGLTIGVTGTRGKSTTTKLIYEMLKKEKRKVFLGGNIGRSVLDFLDQLDEESISVLEISNLMLLWFDQIKISPEISVLTCIYPDHLNRHPSFDHYVKTKTRIFKYQSAADLLVINQDHEITKNLAEKAQSQIEFFSKNDFDYQDLVSEDFHPLAGEYNQENMMGAVKVAKHLDISNQAIKQTIINYQGLYGRQMYMGEVNGVKVINDTCATMPQAVVAALRKYADYPTVLIFGGKDKGLSYQVLAKAIEKYPPKAIVVLSSSGADKLFADLEEDKIKTKIFKGCQTLEQAVAKAMDLADSGDLLLFSPGGSSFERFANEFDRGRQFDQIIKEYENN